MQTTPRIENKPVTARGASALFDLALSPQLLAETRRLRAGETAWDTNHDAGKLIFVREGLLRVYYGFGNGRQRLARLVGPGNWVGAEGIAGANGSRLQVVAAENTLVMFVDAAHFVQAAMADPNAGRELIRQLARQVTAVHAQLSETTLLSCECQLVHALLRLSRNGGAFRDGTRVTLKLTQQDLADALGIARETANGMLQRLGELQLIQKRRGRISFDLVQLEQWSQTLDANANNN